MHRYWLFGCAEPEFLGGALDLIACYRELVLAVDDSKGLSWYHIFDSEANTIIYSSEPLTNI